MKFSGKSGRKLTSKSDQNLQTLEELAFSHVRRQNKQQNATVALSYTPLQL